MTTLALGLISQSHTRTRVHNRGLFHDETIAIKTRDIAAGIGQGNFVDLIGIQPNFSLSALEDRRGQPLL